jgi:transposase
MNGSGPLIRLFSYSPTRSAALATVRYAGIGRGAVLMSDGYGPCNDPVSPLNGLRDSE